MQIQLLHCIHQADTGGDSLLVDGFKAANDLRQADPESFDFLTKTPVEYYDFGHDDYVGNFFYTGRHRVIRYDAFHNALSEEVRHFRSVVMNAGSRGTTAHAHQCCIFHTVMRRMYRRE